MVIYEYHYNGGATQMWYAEEHWDDGGVCVATFKALPCNAPNEIDESEGYDETTVGTVGFCDGYGWFEVIEML